MSNGSRLKYLVEKSGITIKTLVEKSNVSKGSIYNYYEKSDYKDIPHKKLKAILDAIGISEEDFVKNKNVLNEDQPAYSLQERVKELEKTVELLKEQVADKNQIIDLLKAQNSTSRKRLSTLK